MLRLGFSVSRHAILMAGLLLIPPLADAKPGVLFQFGQSESFWKYYSDFSKSGITTESGRDVIRGLRNNFELGVGRVNAHSDLVLKGGDPENWPQRFHFTIEPEGAAAITARGQTANEARMARIFGGFFKGSYQGSLADGLFFDFGFALGAGSQQKVILTDSGSAVSRAEARGVTLAGGLDLKLMYIWRLWRARFIHTLQTEETYFKTISEKLDGNIAWDLRNVSHDWLFRTDMMVSQFNLHGIVAVHPYPAQIFPRFWNRVEEVSADSRPLRSMLGGGAGFTFMLGRGVQFAAMGGYYAGAPGGEVRFRFAKSVTFKASAYSVENSSDYQSFTQRLYGAALEIDL